MEFRRVLFRCASTLEILISAICAIPCFLMAGHSTSKTGVNALLPGHRAYRGRASHLSDHRTSVLRPGPARTRGGVPLRGSVRVVRIAAERIGAEDVSRLHGRHRAHI